jgi:putative N6-adenine-specific DNA methylase
MCGSGTIAIEAAMWSRDMAPGLLRRPYGFQRWVLFEEPKYKDALIKIREQAKARVLPEQAGPSIMALDCDGLAVNLARKLVNKVGLAVHVERLDVMDFMGTDPPGHVITNPPYGVRISRGEEFETRLARAFKGLKGHRVSAICHDRELAKAMHKAPSQEHALWNGDLECRLYSWDL